MIDGRLTSPLYHSRILVITYNNKASSDRYIVQKYSFSADHGLATCFAGEHIVEPRG